MYARRGDDAPEVATDVVSRGSILTVISATGTLEAVDTVQVGTQVSGAIQSLGADFNSIVKKGQVLARLDPSLIQAEIRAGARPTSSAPKRTSSGSTCSLEDAETKLSRAEGAGRAPVDRDERSRRRRAHAAHDRGAGQGGGRAGDAGARGALAGARSTCRRPSSCRRSTASSSRARSTSGRRWRRACRRRRSSRLPPI